MFCLEKERRLPASLITLSNVLVHNVFFLSHARSIPFSVGLMEPDHRAVDVFKRNYILIAYKLAQRVAR